MIRFRLKMLISEFTFAKTGLFTVALIAALSLRAQSPGEQKARVVKFYTLDQASQAVAVDNEHFYVINNSSITQHRKQDGRLIKRWQDQDSLIHHLNSGIVIDGRLYSCNSNYPEYPMASSVEIFDPETLTHVGSHSFGITNGSATWLDRYRGHWYVAFAHYTGRGGEPNRDNRWTRLVRYDSAWRQRESWIFPPELIARFGTRSNSGGVITDDGRILITGHDAPEVYQLRFPDRGYQLRWEATYPVGSYGQGIAYEERGDSAYIYGIVRKENKVVVSAVDSFTK